MIRNIFTNSNFIKCKLNPCFEHKFFSACILANILQTVHTKMSSKNQAGKPIVLFCTGSRFNGFELHRIRFQIVLMSLLRISTKHSICLPLYFTSQFVIQSLILYDKLLLIYVDEYNNPYLGVVSYNF